MLRLAGWIPLLLCVPLAGCLGMNPVGVAFTGSAADYEVVDFDLIFPAENQAGLSSHRPDYTKELALRTQPGSQVTFHGDSHRQFTGILLHADGEHVELLDCLSREPIPAPERGQQMQTSYVRFRSLGMSSLTHLTIISAPAPHFAPPTPPDHCDETIAAVVFMNGRIQRYVRPEEQPVGGLDHLAETPLGSQVRIVDDAGHISEGILLSAGPDSLELMTCIELESVPGPSGVEQCQTNLVPFRTFETSRLTSLAVVAIPDPDFTPPENGADCETYCFAEFVSPDGRRYRWDKPPEREIPDEGMLVGDFVPLRPFGRVVHFRDSGR